MTNIRPEGSRASDGLRGLDAIAREGARRLLAAALEAEVTEHLEAARGQRDGNGHVLVVPVRRINAPGPCPWLPGAKFVNRKLVERVQEDVAAQSRASSTTLDNDS